MLNALRTHTSPSSPSGRAFPAGSRISTETVTFGLPSVPGNSASSAGVAAATPVDVSVSP